MTRSLELAFPVDVGVAPGIGIHERGIQKETLTGRQDESLSQNSDRRLARDAARLGNLRHPPFDGCSRRNHSLAIHHYSLRQLSSERITRFIAEGCESCLQLNH